MALVGHRQTVWYSRCYLRGPRFSKPSSNTHLPAATPTSSPLKSGSRSLAFDSSTPATKERGPINDLRSIYPPLAMIIRQHNDRPATHPREPSCSARFSLLSCNQPVAAALAPFGHASGPAGFALSLLSRPKTSEAGCLASGEPVIKPCYPSIELIAGASQQQGGHESTRASEIKADCVPILGFVG